MSPPPAPLLLFPSTMSRFASPSLTQKFHISTSNLQCYAAGTRPALLLPGSTRAGRVHLGCSGGVKRLFSNSAPRASHENPLGLPRSGTPAPFPRMKRGLPEKRRIPNVKKVILVSSAKGGVGKSTLSINLALALARQGLHTGILDADIYGPSIPTLLNLEDHSPELTPTSTLLPLTSYGLSAMSMGFLVPQHKPIAWRGLLIQKALNQLLFEVSWPSTLDVLVIDLPPGTGDVQLTIMQSVILDGAIVVSTPQTLALRDVQRGVAMMGTMGVEVLGLVQNMSGFVCGGCGMRHEIFGSDGVKKICGELDVPFLGEIPLNASICADADVGKPTMVASPESPSAEAFMAVAEKVRRAIDI